MRLSDSDRTVTNRMADVVLEVYPQRVRVLTTDEKLREEVDASLSYFHPSVGQIRKVNLSKAREKIALGKESKDSKMLVKGQDDERYWMTWDGRMRLFKQNEFPIGMMWRTRSLLRVLGYKTKTIDKRKKPKRLPDDKTPKFVGVLRPYQHKAVDTMLLEDHGILDMGTGAGKTVVACAIIASRAVPTIVIVPNVELANEWLYKFKEFLKFPGESKPGYAMGRQYDIQEINVVNIATLHKALFGRTKVKKTLIKYNAIRNAFYKAEQIIVDECHHAASKQWRELIESSSAYYRMGMTATVDARHDSSDMIYYGLLGEKLISISSRQLTEEGYVTPGRVIFHSVPFKLIPRSKHKWGDPGGAEELGIVYNHPRNQRIIDNTLEDSLMKNRQTMVLFHRIDHGHLLNDLIPIRGRNWQGFNDLKFDLVYGKKEDRREVIDKFRSGETKVLFAQWALLGEGIDIPSIASVVMAGGGKSAIKCIQNIGRGVRLSEGKLEVIIHEYADQGTYIEDHAELRLKTYIKENAYQIEADGTNLENRVKHLQRVGVI